MVRKCLELDTLEWISYGVVCGMFKCVESAKAMINEDDRQDRELRGELCRLVVEAHPEHS